MRQSEKRKKEQTTYINFYCVMYETAKKEETTTSRIYLFLDFYFQRNLHVYKSHQEKGKSKFSPSGMPCETRNREREKSHRTNLYACRFGEVNGTQSKITIPQISLSKKR